MSRKRLTVAGFPAPFDGEVAYFELGLHRVLAAGHPAWETSRVPLPGGDVPSAARLLLDTHPDLVILHVYRDRVREALALVAILAREAGDVPVIWCGWTAQAPYLEAVARATTPLGSSLVLGCGEVEAVLPPILDAAAAGGGAPAALVRCIPALARWDATRGAWEGEGRFQRLDTTAALAPVWSGPVPMALYPEAAAWIEVSRGCRYACAFCIACSLGPGSVRVQPAEKLQEEIHAAHARGARLLGLLAAAVNYDPGSLRAVSRAVAGLGAGVSVAGTVHARHADGERLELLAAMPWQTMIVGLQTLSPVAQRLMGRRERPVAFAAAVERLATFARPEVEVILGLPGDTPEGFRQTVRFVLDLPAAVSVYRLRLDPWSRFLERRAGLGLEADFADMGRIRATPTFPPEALADAEAWLEGLAQGPWFHRARGLSYDGRELVRP